MIKNIIVVFTIFFSMNYQIIAQKKKCKNCIVSIDSITNSDINGDKIKDLVVLTLYECQKSNKGHLEIFLKNAEGKYTKIKNYQHEIESSRVKIEVVDDIIIWNDYYQGSGYSSLRIIKSIFKYFKEINDWCNYSMIDINTNTLDEENLSPGISKRGLCEIKLEKNMFNDSTLRKKYQDSLNIKHTIYLGEFKTKKYNSLKKYDSFETLDYLNFVGIGNESVQQLNDIGYFLCEAGNYQESVYLLQNITNILPSRTVAYLNLGDAYWGFENSNKAKEAYNEYIDQMKKDGKDAKIPKRALERVK